MKKLSNKATDFAVVNDTLYPSVSAVKTYVDSQDTILDNKIDALDLDLQGQIDSNDGDITNLQNTKEDKANKGIANGYAPIGSDGYIPSTFIPNSFDDVLEFDTYADLLSYETPTTGKLYIVKTDETSGGNHSTYRYSGSIYVRVSDEMSANEIKALYESNANTNALTDTMKSNYDEAYNHSQETGNPHDTKFSELLEKPTTLGGFGITDAYDKTYIDSLKDMNGWESELITLTPMGDTDTVLTATLQSYDELRFICHDTVTGEIDTDMLMGAEVIVGNFLRFFDNNNININFGTTDSTFDDNLGGHDLVIYGIKYTELKAEDTTYDNTTSGRTATNVQDIVDEVFSEIDVIETNITNLQAKDIEHEKDLIDHEQRIDSIEAITRKQNSDIASVDDDGIGILHMGKDVAETTVTTKIEGLFIR